MIKIFAEDVREFGARLAQARCRRRLARRASFLRHTNTMNLDRAVAMISPLVDIRMPMGAFTGGKAYREWISEHFRAFPDMHHEIRGITVESDRTLTFEWRATGTFTAPLAMSGGEVSPNGKTIDLPGAEFWRVEGGLIVDSEC